MTELQACQSVLQIHRTVNLSSSVQKDVHVAILYVMVEHIVCAR